LCFFVAAFAFGFQENWTCATQERRLGAQEEVGNVLSCLLRNTKACLLFFQRFELKRVTIVIKSEKCIQLTVQFFQISAQVPASIMENQSLSAHQPNLNHLFHSIISCTLGV